MSFLEWEIAIIGGGILGSLCVTGTHAAAIKERLDKLGTQAAADRYRIISALEQLERNTSAPYIDDEEPLA